MTKKLNPTETERNRLHVWRLTIMNLLMRIGVFKNLFPKSEELFERSPDDPESLDHQELQQALDVQVSLVCIEEACILAYYSIFDNSGKGGNNISRNSGPYITAVKKKLQEIINSSEEFVELHKKIKELRHKILAHHSGQSLEVTNETKNEKEWIGLNENRVTTCLLDTDEFKTFELLCSRIYALIQFDDPLTVPMDEIEDLVYVFKPL